ncbi:D-isomer specific 2-hydroxyacid dehydrogenase family protein [uncultured Paenibacillus sp.]|uniref:D-isomer specific 2-hydroxyacid dehydrogenase family protein n=1 Tax=uncultured Paenibacillus sp. TaxID=227322 RepID=UPI0028040669|nr:D-isomer specific 2-hydroxyacid dehydrogenase family protein [uncultured Paenibacillus sp.]
MMFNQITCVDNVGLEGWALEKLQKHSKQPIIQFDQDPQSKNELMERIQDADGVLVSWRTKIDREVIASHPSIRYIGMCCSLYDERSANVDIAAARAQGIEVRGVRDYGDEGVAEFVMSELIRLLKGLGPHQWLSEPVELQQRKLGIIGMGATGKILAHRASAFGMRVHYFSRNRKPDCEQAGVEYAPLRDLLRTSEIISMHLPRNTQLLGPEEFAALGHGKILVNTSLGAPFDAAAFREWIRESGNYAIFDADGAGEFKAELERYPQIIYSAKVSGFTREARERLSRKVLDNLTGFIGANE